jgi:hypothetical protein
MPSFLAQPLNWWTNFFFIIISNRGYRRAPLTSSVEKLCLNKSSCIWCFLSFSSFSFPFLLLVFFFFIIIISNRGYRMPFNSVEKLWDLTLIRLFSFQEFCPCKKISIDSTLKLVFLLRIMSF